MKKRSQMEIMGIAIVMIILTIVILFVVRWSVMKKPVEHKKEFAQSEIATNLINTLLSTTTDCKEMNFNELFQDCFEDFNANGKTQDCPSSFPKSCNYVMDEIENSIYGIFTLTLEAWNYKYDFSVSDGANTIRIDVCVDEQGNKILERKARSYPLPGGLEAKLAICG